MRASRASDDDALLTFAFPDWHQSACDCDHTTPKERSSRTVHTVHVYWCAKAPTRYLLLTPIKALLTDYNLDQNKKK